MAYSDFTVFGQRVPAIPGPGIAGVLRLYYRRFPGAASDDGPGDDDCRLDNSGVKI